MVTAAHFNHIVYSRVLIKSIREGWLNNVTTGTQGKHVSRSSSSQQEDGAMLSTEDIADARESVNYTEESD